jgi:hypothetical protein
MSGFTLLQVEGVDNNDRKTRVPNVAVEIAKDCRLTFEWDDMFGRYVISLSKFKLEEQLCFAPKVNIMHTSRLQLGLNAIMKHVEDNKLGHLVKKE